MYIVFDDFNSPGRWISVDVQRSRIIETFHWGTKLFRFSWLNLGFALLNLRWQTIERITSVSLLSAPHNRPQET